MKDRRRKLIVSGIILVALLIIATIFFLRKGSSNQPIPIEPTPVITEKPKRDATDSNGYPVYMIEGSVTKIYTGSPFKFVLNVDLEKFLTNKTGQTVSRTITTENDTPLLLHDISASEEAAIKSSDISIGDRVIVWLNEPNTAINDLTDFSATKVLIYRRLTIDNTPK